MVWYNHWGWNCLKKTSSTVSDPFAKGLAYYCWQELPFFLTGSVKSRTERVWRLPTFSPIIFCLLRGHWGDNEVRCVLAVTLTQLRQDFSIQAIVLPIPFKSTKTKCIFFSYLFVYLLNRTWLREWLNIFRSESLCLAQKIWWMLSSPLASIELMYEETSQEVWRQMFFV